MMMMCEAPELCEGDDSLHLMSFEEGAEAFTLAAAPMEEEKIRVGRHPRWSRHETLTLIEAKRAEEAKWCKAKEEREKGIDTGRGNGDSKWIAISDFCRSVGVARSPAQCRKRWCNLSADYRRIRDWQSLRGKQSFWIMSSDIRKDHKLPGCFDREVFEALDSAFAKDPCAIAEVIFDSGRHSADDGVLSDIEHPFEEEDISVSADKMESSPIESMTPSQDQYENKYVDGNFVDACEEKPDVLPGRKRRKRPCVGDDDEFRRDLLVMLESNSKILATHVDSRNFNCHLDRTQRKEHNDNIVNVLGKLVAALGKIADKLPMGMASGCSLQEGG